MTEYWLGRKIGLDLKVLDGPHDNPLGVATALAYYRQLKLGEANVMVVVAALPNEDPDVDTSDEFGDMIRARAPDTEGEPVLAEFTIDEDGYIESERVHDLAGDTEGEDEWDWLWGAIHKAFFVGVSWEVLNSEGPGEHVAKAAIEYTNNVRARLSPQSGDAEVVEQWARDIMERCGWDEAQRCSSGDVVELANLLAELRRRRTPQSQGEA